MPTNRCSAKTAAGEPCRATPRGERGLCLWHDPDLAEAAQEARRVGGQRRRREVTVLAAYEVDGLASIPEIRRVVEVVVSDLLGMENSVARGRALLSAAQVALGLLEKGEFEERLVAIEAVMEPRLNSPKKGRR